MIWFLVVAVPIAMPICYVLADRRARRRAAAQAFAEALDGRKLVVEVEHWMEIRHYG